jgi:hypothetical protein
LDAEANKNTSDGLTISEKRVDKSLLYFNQDIETSIIPAKGADKNLFFLDTDNLAYPNKETILTHTESFNYNSKNVVVVNKNISDSVPNFIPFSKSMSSEALTPLVNNNFLENLNTPISHIFEKNNLAQISKDDLEPGIFSTNAQSHLFNKIKKETISLFKNFNKFSSTLQDKSLINNFFVNYENKNDFNATNRLLLNNLNYINNNFEKDFMNNLLFNTAENKDLYKIEQQNNQNQDQTTGLASFASDLSEAVDINENPQINLNKKNDQLTKENFLDFIKDKYLSNIQTGHKKTTLYLNPPELGRVKVDINITKNNEISAVFMVEHTEIKEIIEKSIEALKVTLEGKGYNITQMAVKQANGNGQSMLFLNDFSQNGRNNPNEQKTDKKTAREENSLIKNESILQQNIRKYNLNSISIII